MSVITAATSQNTLGVSRVHVLPTEFVRSQILDVILDIPPKCVKTGIYFKSYPSAYLGMLANEEIIVCISDILERYRFPCVVDPVTLLQEEDFDESR